ncbi:MAG TPA: alpha/beta hydrolase [Kribbella sp.]
MTTGGASAVGSTPTLRPDRVASVQKRFWSEPSGLNPRGTVFVITGRGETPEVYERFGQRLSADAYRVVAISARSVSSDETKIEIARLVRDSEDVGPRVLIGADLGAGTALEVAAEHDLDLAGLIVAGAATKDQIHLDSWDAEIAASTSCPTHRSVLARTARGSLSSDLNARNSRSPDPRVGVPTLALHGAADTISSPGNALAYYAAAGIAEVLMVADGRHDILNDVSHRSIAARIVLFLEQVRLGNNAGPLITATSTGAAAVEPSPGTQGVS